MTPNLPEAARVQLAAGLGQALTNKLRFDLYYLHLFQEDRRGRTTDGGLAVPTTAVNNGMYSFHANLFGASLVWRFRTIDALTPPGAAARLSALDDLGRDPHDRGCARGIDDQTRRRGRPPRRPFARELAAFRRLVWLPTSAAALTSATLGLLPMMGDLTVATFTFADEEVPG